MSKAVLILGATSPIARATAEALARKGDRVYLASRDQEECSRLANDIAIRYKSVIFSGFFDAIDIDSHPAMIASAVEDLGGLDCLIVAVGDLGDQPNTLAPELSESIFQVNLTGLVSVIGLCAQRMSDQETGVILGIGSVAGDRGRQSNFAYGAAKGGFALYLQGLRNLLYRKGVRVVTFKPGFVDTAMTYGKQGVFLVASPERAGKAIVRAIEGSADVVYFPWFWRWIMLVVRLIPEWYFKRLHF